MPEDTCFMLSLSEPAWDNIRDQLKPYGTLFQVYIPRNSTQTVYVKYKHANSAATARNGLVNDPRVLSICDMEKWPYEKRAASAQQQPQKHLQQPGQPSQPNAFRSGVSGENSFKETSDAGLIPISRPMTCNNCRNNNAELVCSVCAAWYCNEQCQLMDWMNHRAHCIPRLVRGFPVLQSLQNIHLKTQQMHQQQQQFQGFDTMSNFSGNGGGGGGRGQMQRPKAKGSGAPAAEEQRSLASNQKIEPPLNGADSPKQKKPNASPNVVGKPEPKNRASEDRGAKTETGTKVVSQGASGKQSPERGAQQRNEQKNQITKQASAAAPKEESVSKADALPKKKLSLEEGEAAAIVNPKKASPEKRTENTTTAVGTAAGAAVAAEPALTGSSMLMKRMQKKISTAKRTISYGPFPAVGSTVAISFVSDRLLYLHETSDDPSDTFMSLIKRCIQHANEMKLDLQQPPTEGDIVFAPFDDSYYRATVEKVSGETASVVFPDFGNTMTLPWKVLKEISDSTLKYATCITHHAKLNGDDGKPFSPTALTFLTDLIEEQPFKVVQVTDADPEGIRTVELIHKASNYTLSSKIRAMGSAASQPNATASADAASKAPPKLTPTDPATYKPVFGSEFIDPTIPAGADKEVGLTIVEASEFTDSQLVSAIITADQLPFALMMKECEEYAQLDKHQYTGEPEPNYACLVKYDCTWCRALKLAADTDDQYYLLDLGIIRELDKSCPIRRYPPALSRKLYCSEYVVDNPELLTKLMKGGDKSTDSLPGHSVMAKLHIDEDTDQFHMNIMSIKA